MTRWFAKTLTGRCVFEDSTYPTTTGMEEVSALEVTRLGYCLDDDYPHINWGRHGPMADLWLEVDERHRTGQPIADLLRQVTYRLRLNRRWPRIDCLGMMPGLAVSTRARAAFESLEVPGMRFLDFRINDEPFYLFYTDRVVDCLKRDCSKNEFLMSSPDRAMSVTNYVFEEERLRECDVFTVPELSNGMFFWVQETFVTTQARVALEAASLVGLRFDSL